MTPDIPSGDRWAREAHCQRLQNGKPHPPKSLGVRHSFLPTQRFRKPFESGDPASPTSLSIPLSVSFPRLL